MAKLFYTLEEAASKLGKSEAEVQGLIDSGQLQEFRDRDRIMLKVEQVDILAGDDEGGNIPLAESGELDAIDLAGESGSAIGVEGPKDQTGISIFDADETEEADPSAVTHVQGGLGVEFSTDLSSSGSGLMDLTRESDDTSLGGEALLEDIYADEGDTVDETMAGDAGGEELFESTPEPEVGVGGPAGMVAMAEPYDGVWSGILGGAAFAMVVTLGLTIAVVLGALVTNSPAAPLIDMARDNYMAVAGGLGGLTLVCLIIGLLLGKMSS